MTIHVKIPLARRAMLKRQPYLAKIIYTLVPVADPDVQTMGVTEAGTLYYAPAALDRWTLEETAAVVCHECQHVQRDHAGRRRGRPHKKWNIACDLEINGSLRRAGWKLPAEGIYPETFGFAVGLLAEQYFELLTDRHVASIADPTCGSGAGNPGPGGKPSPGRTRVDIEIARRATAQAIQDHAARGTKQRGDIPGDLLVWAGVQLAPPQVDWRARLGGLARRANADAAGAGAYTYRVLSRRGAGLGYGAGRPCLPGVRRPVPKVVLIADTSGSMVYDGPYVLAQVRAVLEAAGGTLHVIASDTKVQAEGRVRSLGEVRSLLKGGGGTDFRPAFAAADKARADVIVIVTDGEGDTPAVPPRGRVIWVLVPGGRRPVLWGAQVQIKEASP